MVGEKYLPKNRRFLAKTGGLESLIHVLSNTVSVTKMNLNLNFILPLRIWVDFPPFHSSGIPLFFIMGLPCSC